MNIFTICVLAVTAVIIITAIKRHNSEIALMLSIACAVMVLLSILMSANDIISLVNELVSVSGINISYIAILIKVIGICLITEFAVNTCKDAGSQSLAGSVSLAGKIMITVTALPLYGDILKTVVSISGG